MHQNRYFLNLPIDSITEMCYNMSNKNATHIICDGLEVRLDA